MAAFRRNRTYALSIVPFGAKGGKVQNKQMSSALPPFATALRIC